jgi:predicted transcriptional regulator
MSKRSKLSDANFEIMRVIWDLGEATVNEIHSAVNAKRDDGIKRESVQVQVKRLEKYGWLKRRKRGKVYHYSALADRDETMRDILEDVKDRVFGGSRAELVRCLFESSEISEAELVRIRRLLDTKTE